ncbi:MAG: helix-turn-helix transcriptional regulator [Clostridia bacterium]|nr:helix-turn-helix transcriptional regulator [Clostridia bacterium]
MEFNERLQALRKQKGLTQEELAQALFVSRTAISKWESGRGYPSIDSLKAIAEFFGVTIDALLTGGEALSLAQQEHQEKESRFLDLVFGLLDLSAVMFLFLPFFSQHEDGMVAAASALTLNRIAPCVKAAYWAAVIALILSGIASLVLRSCRASLWLRHNRRLSLALHAAALFLFIISPQPYAAAYLFILLAIKGGLLAAKRSVPAPAGQ